MRNDEKTLPNRENKNNETANAGYQQSINESSKKDKPTKTSNSQTDKTSSVIDQNIPEPSTKNQEIDNTKVTKGKLSDKLKLAETGNLPFIYDFSGQVLAFLRKTDDFVMRCPTCQIETKYIIRHLGQREICKGKIDLNVFKDQFKTYKKDKEKKDNAIRQRIHREKMMTLDEKKAKELHAKQQRIHIEKMMKLDEKKAKEVNATKQRIHREKMMKLDENKAKELNVKYQRIHIEKMMKLDEKKAKEMNTNKKRLSLGRRKAQDHQTLKNDQKAWQQKHRKIESASDRLSAFKEATLYSSIFICTCCHQRMFKSNVRIFTRELENQLNINEPGLTNKCIEKPTIPTQINGQDNRYICLTCVKHMKNGKMPPMSTKNNLTLAETDRFIKDQNLDLTELEAALIAKNIIFQKIFQLPKSRWTALKDKVVNVPIKED